MAGVTVGLSYSHPSALSSSDYDVVQPEVVDPEGRQFEVSVLRDRGYSDPLIVRTGACESVTQPGLTVDADALFVEME